MENSKLVTEAINWGVDFACKHSHGYITPEHFLVGMCGQTQFVDAAYYGFFLMEDFRRDVENYLINNIEKEETDELFFTINHSVQWKEMQSRALFHAENSGRTEIFIDHFVAAILELEESNAAYLLRKHFNMEDSNILNIIIDAYREGQEGTDPDNTYLNDEDYPDWMDDAAENTPKWKSYVVCLNDTAKSHNPLIGREAELERTIQVLCRKDKNNPLHVGEAGVGKTSIVYGLASMINEGNVPDKLKECKIYSMDMGTLLAGTQYRGDFEKRVKSIMDGIQNEGNAIVYIDEIHNMVGAGQISDGSLDASNMLKPYLEDGAIRFIGSTTYQEYNRYFSKSKGIVRRFQQIDIQEPSIDETVKIIEGLIPGYETFHNVIYAKDVIHFAVENSSKYITDRFLPDKAIDLIDEAGAYRQLHPVLDENGEKSETEKQIVDVKLVSDILAKVCKIDAKVLIEDSNVELENLEERICCQIYGQDKAVKHVVEAVQMSKAGLLEADKPLASLLFVGPTGVGKTEVCKVLAKELGIELVRFDMSEYTEKHAVAKLIGSPAGYVGYEDGGLLTDAIRKTPNCVLLLDEIEKAHSDIYNILLQVMDYARLTDNKGNKANFKNVILVMTSNAGAQYAHQASVGFAGNTSKGEAMMATVKKTFKPEFLNRLSGTVIFNDMDKAMASLILDKKLNQLKQRLEAKNVTMTVSEPAHDYLLTEGFTKQYGAREMDRVIQNKLNPLLMREILFGILKDGGHVTVEFEEGKVVLK